MLLELRFSLENLLHPWLVWDTAEYVALLLSPKEYVLEHQRTQDQRTELAGGKRGGIICILSKCPEWPALIGKPSWFQMALYVYITFYEKLMITGQQQYWYLFSGATVRLQVRMSWSHYRQYQGFVEQI